MDANETREDGEGNAVPESVRREVENAVGAYENVHGKKPRRQVFEVEYGDELYRARVSGGREGGASIRFYRAPNVSTPYRTLLGFRSVARDVAGLVRDVCDEVSALGTRETVLSAFGLVLVAVAIAAVAGFGVVGSSPGHNTTDATNSTNGTVANATETDIINGSFVFNEIEAERLILEETNDVRARHGVGRVRRVDALSRAATGHARNMAENEYVGHVTPTGDDVGDRYVGTCEPEKARGYTTQRYTENAAAVSFDTPLDGWNDTELRNEEEVAEFVVKAWLESEDHRDNLLDPEQDGVGVGVHFRDGRVFAVQAFC